MVVCAKQERMPEFGHYQGTRVIPELLQGDEGKTEASPKLAWFMQQKTTIHPSEGEDLRLPSVLCIMHTTAQAHLQTHT